ncbi:uncharacterized protein LOC133179098 [Saccostrea echinata]|uniref:uncharacterized protein LOC133179098 n=1 Tax=Saccostrea echinata TaxID=191078 RepID=UPI002A81DF9F|nr:uncharacterized protein LOC133179098 [Saccostrea echinata]
MKHLILLLFACFSGVSSECNLLGISQCFQGLKMPDMDSTPDLQTACTSYRQVINCIEPYKSACAADSTFQSMMSSLNMVSGYCGGDSSCNVMKCYTDAGINMDNSGSGFPNISCEVYVAVKTCLDAQSSACQGNTIYSTVQDALKPVEKMCSSADGSSCDVLKCFSDAGINLSDLSENPRNISCPTFWLLKPCFESQRSSCQGNQLYTVADSYRPQFEKRCPQQSSPVGGTPALAANWILLCVVLLAMVAIFQ